MTRSLSERLTLASIHMHSCSHARGDGAIVAEPTVATSGSMSKVATDANQLAFAVSTTYSAKDNDDRVIAEGEVTYVVVYDLDEGPAPEADEIEEYAHHGALFQVFPFVREHVS